MLSEEKRRCNFLCQSRGTIELGPEQVKISTDKNKGGKCASSLRKSENKECKMKNTL